MTHIIITDVYSRCSTLLKDYSCLVLQLKLFNSNYRAVFYFKEHVNICNDRSFIESLGGYASFASIIDPESHFENLSRDSQICIEDYILIYNFCIKKYKTILSFQ